MTAVLSVSRADEFERTAAAHYITETEIHDVRVKSLTAYYLYDSDS